VALWIIRAPAASAPVRRPVADRLVSRWTTQPPYCTSMSMPAQDGSADHRNGSCDAAAADRSERPVVGHVPGRTGPPSQTAMKRAHAYRVVQAMDQGLAQAASAALCPLDGRCVQEEFEEARCWRVTFRLFDQEVPRALLASAGCSCIAELWRGSQLGGQFGQVCLHLAIDAFGLCRSEFSGILKGAKSRTAVSWAAVFVQGIDLGVLRPGNTLLLNR
jgi:hypothetical protein